MAGKRSVLLSIAPLVDGYGVRVDLTGSVLDEAPRLSPEEARILADALVDIAELAETYDGALAARFTKAVLSQETMDQ